MAIIYTYPPISDLQLDDLVVVTDKSNKNSTRQASISQILDLSPPVVDSLNGFTGNVNIIAGNNISVDNVTGQNNIEISTTSNTTSSGNNGEFAFFAGTGSNLEGSPLLTTSGTRVYLQDYIYHKDNVGVNEARFGFNTDNSFLIYLDETSAQERLTLSNDSFKVWTGLTTKITAGANYSALSNELDTVDPTKSQIVIKTNERGFKVSTTYRSDTAGSDLGFGGQIQFAASQDAGSYVGLMGPISGELTDNYNLMLPNTPPTSGQLLAVGSTAFGTPPNMFRKLEWIDGSSAVGVTQLTAGSGISLSPSSGIGVVEVSLEGDIDGALLQQVLVKEPGGVSKGDVVYISGGTGDNPEIMKAQANSSTTMAALGIMKNNTAVDAIGECVTSGEITGLDLTGFVTGDELFVSNTVAGELLTSAPTGEANLIQKIGKVIKGGNGGALTVLGAFRTNATPNLNEGSIFIGNASNQTETLPIGANGTILTSDGTTADWVTINSIGGTIETNIIPVGTATDTIGASIIDQDISGLPHRINISSPIENLNPGDLPKYPVLRLTSGARKTSWTAGDDLGSIEFYHDENSVPTNPHIGASIKSVASKLSDTRVATGSDLQFSTAKYAVSNPNDALLSMTLTELGELQMTQNGVDGVDADYRAGNVSVQKTGEFRLYSGSFTGEHYSLKHDQGVLKIGQLSSTVTQESIGFYINGSQKVYINPDGGIEADAGAVVEGHFTLPEVPVTPSAGTATCDLNNGNQFRIASMNSNTTITFANAVSGDEFTLSVTRTTNGAGANITWANAYWPGDVDPAETNTAAKIDIYKFTKVGASIYGRVVGLNYTIQS
jgi:hypothetical protein